MGQTKFRLFGFLVLKTIIVCVHSYVPGLSISPLLGCTTEVALSRTSNLGVRTMCSQVPPESFETRHWLGQYVTAKQEDSLHEPVCQTSDDLRVKPIAVGREGGEATPLGPAGVSRRQCLAIGLSLASAVALPRQARSEEDAYIWRPVLRPGGNTVFKDIKQAESTYPLEFVEYLSKFLLNYDEPSKKLWKQKQDLAMILPPSERQQIRLEQFGSFVASVEYGLRSYNGTDGAARLCRLLAGKYGDKDPSTLLQIAILFTFMDKFQPSSEIRNIVSRAQNAKLTNLTITNRGSGYVGKSPKVLISTDYEPTSPARAEAFLRETGRVLRVRVTDPGFNFTKPPKVVFEGLASSQDRSLVLPDARAVLDKGVVKAISVRSGGSGIFSPAVGVDAFLAVTFVPREEDAATASPGRGIAVLDQEVSRVEIKQGGSGYTTSYPFKISIQSPQECGGDANGTKAALSAKFSPSTLPDKLDTKAAANKTGTNKIDNLLTKLLPASVGVAFDKEKQRFTIVEKSLLGNEIETERGPRRPIMRENKLDTSVYARLAASGALCASIAHGLLVPLDTVKIRMQTEPPGKYKGAADAAVKILTQEGGLSAIVRGLQPEVVGFCIYGAISFAGTEFFKRNVAELAGFKFALLYPIPIVIVSSVSAAVAASAANCPFMAVKTRLIADESFAGGSLVRGLNRVVEEEGASALFAGIVPLILKEVLFVMSKFAVFEFVRDSIFLFLPELENDVSSTLLVSLISGTIAGTVSAITSQPGDYLFSKASEAKGATLAGAWREYLDSKRYGDMLTGLQPRLFFGGALIALQFVIYDYCRVQFHVSPNDLNSFLDVMASVGKT